jgi:hypothetical protein
LTALMTKRHFILHLLCRNIDLRPQDCSLPAIQRYLIQALCCHSFTSLLLSSRPCCESLPPRRICQQLISPPTSSNLPPIGDETNIRFPLESFAAGSCQIHLLDVSLRCREKCARQILTDLARDNAGFACRCTRHGVAQCHFHSWLRSPLLPLLLCCICDTANCNGSVDSTNWILRPSPYRIHTKRRPAH